MQSLDIFLLPSLWEGFGYVMTEAMVCRKPVIAFNLRQPLKISFWFVWTLHRPYYGTSTMRQKITRSVYI